MYSSVIGLFPLPLLLLPGENTQLHIFEPRYKQLINECVANETPFGIPVILKNESVTLGSLVNVKKIVQYYNNGELDIEIECLELVSIESMYKAVSPKLYDTGMVKIISQSQFKSNDVELIQLLNKARLLNDKSWRDKDITYPILSVLEILSLDTKEKIALIIEYLSNADIAILKSKLLYFNKLSEQEKQLNYRFYLN